ncbi:MAG: [FeFe] hydrogenase H-cluster maturation GTPase HydF [Lachnospiraceae bacterium]
MAVTLQDTPSSNRVHIGLFGRRNAGKSSLLNAFTGQQTSIVSDLPGTTTDPVKKPMELHGIGPCVFWDTAGYDDQGEIGQERVEKTRLATEKVDVALLIFDGQRLKVSLNEKSSLVEKASFIETGASGKEFAKEIDLLTLEKNWFALLREKNTPVILLVNKADELTTEEEEQIKALLQKEFSGNSSILFTSAVKKRGLKELHESILRAIPEPLFDQSILQDLVQEGDLVLLVMPQDIQAPKGRLILPQVQTLRELLDKKCSVISCTTDTLKHTLDYLSCPPKLIVTDSQAFRQVYAEKPSESLLTSFSVLFAAQKGDIRYYVESAKKLEALSNDSKVLIAECCTHAPLAEDIGREKIPRLLRKRFGENLSVQVVSGTDFPEDLSGYDMVIQCGGCMFNRKYVLSRIERAKKQQIPMSNYGIVLAYLAGILDDVAIPGEGEND